MRITSKAVAESLHAGGYRSETVTGSDVEWAWEMLREADGLGQDRTKSRGDGYSMSDDRIDRITGILRGLEKDSRKNSVS